MSARRLILAFAAVVAVFASVAVPAFADTAPSVNSVVATPGTERTFRTFSTSVPLEACSNARPGLSAALPDCRAYEQVTSTDKDGGNPQGALGIHLASPGGDAVLFFSQAGLPGSVSESEFPILRSSRGSAAWSTEGMAAPSTNLSIDIVSGVTPGLSESIDQTTRVGSGSSLLLRDNATGSITTIVPFTKGAGYHFAAASADGSQILFEAAVALTPGAAVGHNNLYLWDRETHQLTLAGALETGVAPPEGSFAGPYDWEQLNTTELGGASGEYETDRTISADGSKVFFTAAGSGQLYVRENGTTTVHVSASQRTVPDPNGPRPAAFRAATPEGSQVLFTSSEQLTNDATTGPADEGDDLYRFDTTTGSLADLTPDTNAETPNGAEVQGVVAQSNDGSYIYFVANGVLATGASPGDCNGSVVGLSGEGTCNLYELHDGALTFITRLQASAVATGAVRDMADWSARNSISPPDYQRTSRVSTDGQVLLFSSVRRLTSYDNAGRDEFYRYQAATRQLDCVSCDPSGAAPVASASLGNVGATSAPQFSESTLTRNLSADGSRIFFESSDALTAADTNGLGGCPPVGGGPLKCQDVYEWEAVGSGTCQVATAGNGCLHLISTGNSPDPSYFSDASADGRDVFFYTTQSLVDQDQDQIRDIYDAREAGGLASQNSTPVVPCAGENCRPAASISPSAQTPASSVFAGPGNLTPPTPVRVKPKRAAQIGAQKLAKALRACHAKHSRHKRRACEAQARTRYGTTKAKKATHTTTTRKGGSNAPLL